MCRKLIQHWEDRDQWLGVMESTISSELWHGERFKQLSWFWDPSSRWILPCRCTFCRAVIEPATILAHIDDATSGTVEIVCGDCREPNEIQPVYATGDPRNIALIGHWDGWQPFKTAAHSCGKNLLIVELLEPCSLVSSLQVPLRSQLLI